MRSIYVLVQLASPSDNWALVCGLTVLLHCVISKMLPCNFSQCRSQDSAAGEEEVSTGQVLRRWRVQDGN